VTAPRAIDAETLETLEFPAVLAIVAGGTTCEPGRSEVSALRPYAWAAQAQTDFGLIDDAVGVLEAGGDIAFAGAAELGDRAERAAVGATLSGAELVAIARTERALADAAAALRRPPAGKPPGELGPLARLASTRADTNHLLGRLEAALDGSGALLDTASGSLAKLRAHMRSLTEEIRRRVEDIVRNPNTARLLSEHIVTVRDGRYVIPVRTESVAQFPGVVHDQSASGATVYVEPMACVEANNKLRGLEAAHERECQRILNELSALVGAHAEHLAANLRLLARLDGIGARARWARARGALPPRLVEAPSLRIVRGRHPLLRREAVPLDFSIGESADAVIISGPNMGGKTVVLKTVGLLCALAYAGIPIPAAAGTEIGDFDRIACIIGDEQSIANDLSSFSAHLRALRGALARAGPRSLVLVDEIGSGTEPSAGAALAQAILEALLRAGSRVVVTTHYTQLKTYAAESERVANASMLFDAQTREPTFVLAMGVPGQSHAFALAQSLGFDRDVLDRSEQLFGEHARDLEHAFENLAAERERLHAAREEADAESRRLRAAHAQVEERLAQALRDREAFEKKAADALDQAVRSVREEIAQKADRSERDARRQRTRSASAHADLDKTMREIRRSLGLERDEPSATGPAKLAVGDRVFVRGMQQHGIVGEIYQRDVLVMMGSAKTVVPRADLTLEAGPGGADAQPFRMPGSQAASGPALDARTSVDLRGMRVDEAWPLVDKALDDASIAGLTLLRIIHGKGTGQLGRGIREFLRGHPHVQSVEFAPDREGGTGVTVVTLR
jgi:DNA mismatch repair protein MutS2